MALTALPDLLRHHNPRRRRPLIILPRRHPLLTPFRPRRFMAQSGWEGHTTTGTAAGAGATGITGILEQPAYLRWSFPGAGTT
jgi:hypothetical protein